MCLGSLMHVNILSEKWGLFQLDDRDAGGGYLSGLEFVTARSATDHIRLANLGSELSVAVLAPRAGPRKRKGTREIRCRTPLNSRLASGLSAKECTDAQDHA